MRTIPLVASLGLAVAVLATGASAQEKAAMTAQDKIAEALAGGPAELASGAAVVDWDGTTLREGSNGWTCFPDVPQQPGVTPMCLDGQWLKWADAWMNKKPTTGVTGVGLAYMLMGGGDASNTDPYAEKPAEGEDWVHSGPHVMIIVPDPKDLDGLPTDPNSGGPYVMWKGTPYVHIMMPISGPKAMKDKEHKH